MSATDVYAAPADDARRAGLKRGNTLVTVRYDDELTDDGRPTIDEVLAPGVHLETMDEDSCWIWVLGYHVWLRAVRVPGRRRPRLVVTGFADDCVPYRSVR